MSTAEEVDSLMQKIAQFGNDNSVMEQVQFTYPLLLPAQNARKAEYRNPDTEASYGEHPRQKLDVYLPKLEKGKQASVLLFTYGGGFMMGDKIEYIPLGNYFSRQGFVTVMPDYRRVPDGAKYPSGAEDLSLALQWLAKGEVKEADLDNVFFLGASAGGMHLATLLWGSFSHILHPSAISDLNLRGIIFLSIKYHTADISKVGPPDALYYGSPELFQQNSPHSLRLKSSDKTPLLAMHATYDPRDEFKPAMQPFLDMYKEKADGFGSFEAYECKGHNHISLPLTLNLGYGSDEWGDYASQWMRKLSA